ncbi:Sir2 family NAD-dependent protein deacetylase [bacterium]|nr:Sir2 family NAD-dependent protein deacetylase [bacterium]
MMKESGSTVVFTGAGISTESGIPDFRSPGGIWSQSKPVFFDEFLRSAEARRESWRQKEIVHRDFSQAAPNAGHRAIARWESAGLIDGVITQNIDGLHQAAGNEAVLELHGTARAIACLTCEARYDVDSMMNLFRQTGEPPECPQCGGYLKSATVSFGQPLPEDILLDSIRMAEQCELFLAIGSSLVVEPAASLPRSAKRRGARLIIINRDSTPLDDQADRVYREAIGAFLTEVDQLLRR